MARRLGKAPFELEFVDTDGPVDREHILDALEANGGAVTLCVRSEGGSGNRGGYYFHVKQEAGAATYVLLDFESKPVVALSLPQLVAFVNHASGRAFDEDSLVLCKQEVNFRLDPE